VNPFDRLRQLLTGGGPQTRVHVSDPRFDSWEVVREFGDLKTALAFADRLREVGLDAALTADWELDQFGRGEIYLQVPPDQWSDAESTLSGYDLD
jgi:hypothetical protein